MDLRQIYETFFLRDILSHAVPGALVLLAIGLGACPHFVMSVFSWSGPWQLAVVVPFSYLAGLGLSHTAVWLRFCASDHNWAIFADPFDRAKAEPQDPTGSRNWPTRIVSWLTRIVRRGSKSRAEWSGNWLTRILLYPAGGKDPYEQHLRSYYLEMSYRDGIDHLRAQVSRQSLLKQTCGHFACALFVLAIAQCWWPSNFHDLYVVLGKRSLLVAELGDARSVYFRVSLPAIGAVLLIAHFRHARFQALMWETFGRRLALAVITPAEPAPSGR